MTRIKPKGKKKRPNYKRAFNFLMDYWDYLPDEDKKIIDEELNKCNL